MRHHLELMDYHLRHLLPQQAHPPPLRCQVAVSFSFTPFWVGAAEKRARFCTKSRAMHVAGAQNAGCAAPLVLGQGMRPRVSPGHALAKECKARERTCIARDLVQKRALFSDPAIRRVRSCGRNAQNSCARLMRHARAWARLPCAKDPAAKPLLLASSKCRRAHRSPR